MRFQTRTQAPLSGARSIKASPHNNLRRSKEKKKQTSLSRYSRNLYYLLMQSGSTRSDIPRTPADIQSSLAWDQADSF